MGFNTTGGKGSGRSTTYAKLMTGEGAGFKVGSGDAFVVHGDAAGHVAGFYVREALNYEVAQKLRAAGQDPNKVDLVNFKPEEKHFEATLRLRDADPTQNDIGIQFRLDDSLGGKLVGILNNLRIQGKLTKDALANPAIVIAPFYRAPNSRYNDTNKGKTSLNVWPADMERSQAAYIQPIYSDADGNPLMETDPGRPAGYAGLPMGKEVKVGNKTLWDHTDRDNVVMNTAAQVVSHMKSLYESDEAGQEEGVDFAEAASAAAPGQG